MRKMLTRGLLVAILCACRPASPPDAPRAPLPPDPTAATESPSDATPAPEMAAAKPTSVADWPKLPTVAAVPASNPTGAPIIVPSTLPKVGETARYASPSVFTQHYWWKDGTRYQKTDRDIAMRVKVLEVTGDHPSKIEVAVENALESIALADAPTTTLRQRMQLLSGTYVVAAPKAAGPIEVTRADGGRIYSAEQEELASLFGGLLRDGNAAARFLKSQRLRLGEAVVLGADAKRVLTGDAEPGPETVTLSLTRADARAVTYQLDVTSPTPIKMHNSTVEGHIQTITTFELPSGRLIESTVVTRKTERYADTVNDTYARDSLVIEY